MRCFAIKKKGERKKVEKIKFGTDGWRAIISKDFTFENVQIVAQAIAEYVKNNHKSPKVAVGYDTRFLSEKYAELVACVLAGNGVEVILSDRACPTPSLSFVVASKKLSGGVMITASHNPPSYNGIKYKTFFGGSAGLEIIAEIESNLSKNPVVSMPIEAAKDKNLLKIEDICTPYIKHVKKYLDLNLLKNAKLKVLVDIMYGAGNRYMEEILSGSNCKVTTIHTEKNPSFGGINPEPIEKNLQELISLTKKDKFDIGLATDGDVDRIGAASPDGKIISSHKIICLILLHFIEDKKLKGSVVKTISGSTLTDKICKKYKITMHETPVGFKYIADYMLKEDVLVGGEESGGIGFINNIPERDGLISGILLLEMMAKRKKSILQILKDVEKEYGSFEFQREDIKYPDDKKKLLMEILKTNPPKEVLGKKVVEIKSFDGFKLILEDGSWLMLRLSGTEPILRVYAEASSIANAKKILGFGKEFALNIK